MNNKEKTYLQGLIDAWEMARTIALPPTKGGMGYNDLVECFNMARNDVFCLPVSEVKEKYDIWKGTEKQDNCENIKTILEDHLDYIYCFNCKYRHNPEGCDECHRKYMRWALSDEWAQTIAEKIIKLMEK